MYRFLFVVLIFVGTGLSAFAQLFFIPEDSTYSHLDDTLQIQEVEIISPVSKQYQVGSKNQTFTPIQKQNVIYGSLTNLLSRYSPIYIKTDAGGLASFSIRGTSSTHTSVFIGGLDINSLTLGSSNSSNIPIFLFDNLNLSYGSSSAANGSGSIGGSVRLGLNSNFNNGINGEIIASTGSFGEYFGGAKVFISNGKLESVTRFQHYQIENDFPFLNTAYYDRELKTYHTDKQRNASIENKHFIQQFNYKINDNQIIESFVWYSDTWHEAQPNMTSNINLSTSPRPIEDENFRSWISYKNHSNRIQFAIEGGYVKDKAIDNNDYENTIETQRAVGNIALKFNTGKIKYQFDAKYKYIIPEVYAYSDNILEQHLDLHGAIAFCPISKLKTTLNLRQQYVTKYHAPFTPALGLDYILLSKENHLLKAVGNIQKSYKIPTLNARYWGQEGYSGNENILPEEAFSYETGIDYMYNKNSTTVKFKANYYFMDVDNWIIWIQSTNAWTAQNILKVEAKGIEIQADLRQNIGPIKVLAGINFALNSTVNKKSNLEGENSDNYINRQVIYTPKQIGNSFISVLYKSYNLNIDGSYTGFRYFDYTDDKIDGYKLINISGGKDFHINNSVLSANLSIDNILSEQYQNQYQYAMPEINWHFTIKYKF